MDPVVRMFIKISLRIFGPFIENQDELLLPLQRDLRSADMRITVEEYISGALMASLLVPMFFTPTVFIAMIAIGLPPFLAIVPSIFAYIFLLIISISGFYFYPTIQAGELKKQVTNALPFASVYLSTLAGTGMPPREMFRILAGFKEYGPVSDMAASITRDTELMGMDITSALERAAERTPSPELKEMLWGMITAITTGGDLKIFLIEKSKGYMQSYRRNLDKFVEELSLYTEIYITAVIVGSIFFIVMSTIMSMIGAAGGMMDMIQSVVTYIGLPLVSIGFLMLVSSISP